MNWASIGSDNGLSPIRHQAISWTNGRIFLIGHLGTNFSEILIANLTFSSKKMRLKVSSAKWRQFLARSQCVNIYINTFKSRLLHKRRNILISYWKKSMSVLWKREINISYHLNEYMYVPYTAQHECIYLNIMHVYWKRICGNCHVERKCTEDIESTQYRIL